MVAFAAAGRAPFAAPTFTATSYAIVNKPPDLRPLAGSLLEIITACLAKDPASRPTASALLTYLYRTRPAASPGPPLASPLTPTSRSRRPSGSGPDRPAGPVRRHRCIHGPGSGKTGPGARYGQP